MSDNGCLYAYYSTAVVLCNRCKTNFCCQNTRKRVQLHPLQDIWIELLFGLPCEGGKVGSGSEEEISAKKESPPSTKLKGDLRSIRLKFQRFSRTASALRPVFFLTVSNHCISENWRRISEKRF
jgi:hypothetical protein